MIRLSAQLLRMVPYSKDLELGDPIRLPDVTTRTMDLPFIKREKNMKQRDLHELPIAMLVIKLTKGRVPKEIVEPDQLDKVVIEVRLGSATVKRHGGPKIVPE